MKSLKLPLILLLCSVQTIAQEKTRSSIVEEDTPHYGRRVALIVGTNYTDSRIELDFAESDAKEIHDILQSRYGFQCRLVLGTDATEKAVKTAVQQETKDLTQDDCFLFYFAGHGEPSGRVFYLLPTDATEKDSVNRLQVSDVLNSANSRNSDGFRARHALFLLDCCYSGQGVDWLAKTYDSRHIQQREFRANGMQVITSGSSSQKVPDDSPFAREFVRALDTRLDSQEMFTARELFTHLEKRLKDKNQIPQYGEANLRVDANVGGDFHFMPVGDWEHESHEQNTIVYQTLASPPGKWWFDEMPWLTPGIRLLLDGEQNVRTRVDPNFPPSNEGLQPIDATTLKGIAGLRSVASEKVDLELGGDVQLGLKGLLKIRPNSTTSRRKDIYAAVLNSLQSMRGDSSTTSHLKALLLHATGADASEEYKTALDSYKNENPALHLRCLVDFAEWHVKQAARTSEPAAKLKFYTDGANLYREASEVFDELPNAANSPLVKLEILCGEAKVHRLKGQSAPNDGKWADAYRQSESLYKLAAKLADEFELSPEHAMRGFIAKSTAWTLMDQWKFPAAAEQFTTEHEVWSRIELAGSGDDKTEAKINRCHAAHGLAAAKRLTGEDVSDDYKSIVKDIRAEINAARNSESIHLEKLRSREQNTLERLADSYLFGERANIGMACYNYQDSLRGVELFPEDTALSAFERVCAKWIISGVIGERRTDVTAALDRRSYLRGKFADTDRGLADVAGNSIYVLLSNAFELIHADSEQEGIDQIRQIIKDNKERRLRRDEQELLLLATTVMTEIQQREDGRSLQKLTKAGAVDYAADFLRTSRERSIELLAPGALEDTKRSTALVESVRTARGNLDSESVVFFFFRSKPETPRTLVMVLDGYSKPTGIREFAFSAADVTKGLSAAQIAKVNEFLASCTVPDSTDVHWADDTLVKIEAAYPFSIPKTPQLR